MEQWKPVPGYEGRYEASNQGRVRSFARSQTGRVIKPFRTGDKGEYLAVHLGAGKTKGVHALVALAFIGPCPTGCEVAHRDGCASNNRASNLRYATPKDNSNEKRQHGTLLAGQHHPRAVLTESKVLRIRSLAGRMRQEDIARAEGVAQTTVSSVIRRRTWAHV